MKILVTGGAGYIGSVLVRLLLHDGHSVKVLDSLQWGGESLLGVWGHPNFELIHGDVREASVLQSAVAGCDAVVHLAAVVGDPACAVDPELTRSVNLEGSHLVYEAATNAGCERFIFASTCSNYGKMAEAGGFVTETSELRPVSLYAETKVAFEQFLLGQNRDAACQPTCLRFSTVYGVSPRMRFDLTVNEFVRDLALGKELVVFGEQFWRPYCHVEDLSRSVIHALKAPKDDVAFEVFNVGATEENYTKKMLVELMGEVLDTSGVKYVHKEEDPRDYRVDFTYIREKLGFEVTWKMPAGITQLANAVRMGVFRDPFSKAYGNT